MSASERFHNIPDLHSVSYDAGTVTPSDTVDLDFISRALYIGGAGDVVVITKEGHEVTFKSVPAGAILPIRVSRVKDTDTTATNIVWLV